VCGRVCGGSVGFLGFVGICVFCGGIGVFRNCTVFGVGIIRVPVDFG